LLFESFHMFAGRWRRERCFADKNSDSNFCSEWSS